MSGGNFERELKGILRGDEDSLESATKTCTPEEREAFWRITQNPFTVLRAAGSFGIDLVAIRGDVSFPIEVKSSKGETLWLSNSQRTISQAKELLVECSRAGLLPLYAYRLKNSRGDSWRLFTVGDVEVEGPLRRIQKDMAKVELSKEGHFILRWSDGWPLHRFISYMCNGGGRTRRKTHKSRAAP